MDRIIFIGFMGTGKTCVGKEVARRMNWKFIDLDEQVERIEKSTITTIMKNKGESYFRKVEKKALLWAAEQPFCVIATGGGVILDDENRQIIRRSGFVVKLDARLRTIYARVSEHVHRPLVLGRSMEQIEEIIREREAYYRIAHCMFSSEQTSPVRLAKQIVQAYARFRA